MNASNIKLLAQPHKQLGDGYLQFKLNENTTAVLLVNFTQEVVVSPIEAITPIANKPELILGLINWRNRIIWVVDLPRIFGFESNISPMGQCNIIMTRHGAETIGLMVPEIKGTVSLNSDNIQPADNQVAPHIIPYLKGCIWQEDELHLVFNMQSILQSLFLQEK